MRGIPGEAAVQSGASATLASAVGAAREVASRGRTGIDPGLSPAGFPLPIRLALILILLALLVRLASVVALPVLVPMVLIVLDMASLDLLCRVCRSLPSRRNARPGTLRTDERSLSC